LPEHIFSVVDQNLYVSKILWVRLVVQLEGVETELIGRHEFLHISYRTLFKVLKSTLYIGSLKSGISPRPGAGRTNERILHVEYICFAFTHPAKATLF
jgi:hypothetical protein